MTSARSETGAIESLRLVRRVLWITLILNLAATVAKLVAGYRTGSLSITASGYDSVFDVVSNIIGLIGVSVASQPADADHPYGHRKAESLTTLVMAMLLFLTTWELIKGAVARIRDPSLIDMEVSAWSYGVLVFSIMIYIFVAWYELRAGRKLKSDVLIADAMNTRADIFVSLSMIVGVAAVQFGYPIADPILALVIALAIAKIGVDIIRESASPLLDRVVMPADEMLQVAMSVPGVLSSHRVRSRGHEGAVYADLHIRVDPALKTAQAHAIAHEVQYRLRERRPEIQDVTIHVEPAGPPAQPRSEESIMAPLRRLADGMGVTIHSVWANQIGGSYSATVHMEVDGALSLREAHDQASLLETRARQLIPSLTVLTTHIEPRGGVGEAEALTLDGQFVAESVREIVGQAPEVRECHGLEIGEGASGWSVSLHCSLPGEMAVTEAHDLISELENRIRRGIPGTERVVIHAEPERDAPPTV